MADITTTPAQLVRKALLLIGAVDRDKLLTGTELNDGMDTLNAMLASWATNKLKVNAISKESFTLSVGQGSYTMGESGADWTTDRPLAVLSGYITSGDNIDYALENIGREDWNNIVNKGNADRPYAFYYHASAPLATLYFDRTPSIAETVYFDTQKGLSNFTDPDTVITLPANYHVPIYYNLAIMLAPEYGMDVSDAVKGIAFDSLNDLKVLNSEPFISDQDLITLRRRPTNGGVDTWGEH